MDIEKPQLSCSKCGTPYHFPKKRSWPLRNVLFFLPVKVFFCAFCLKDRYVWITDKEYKKFKKVI